jgi:hypothetical protein
MGVISFVYAAQILILHSHDRFYYDFYFPTRQLSETDLVAIKKEMDRIIKMDLPIVREEVSRDDARSVFIFYFISSTLYLNIHSVLGDEYYLSTNPTNLKYWTPSRQVISLYITLEINGGISALVLMFLALGS